MREHEIQGRIQAAICEKPGWITIRLNSGTAWGGDKIVYIDGVGNVLTNPRKISLCPPGTPDILAIGPEGEVAFIECKTLTGKAREAQKRFIALMHKLGHKAGIARSPEDAVKIVEGK